MEADCKSEVFEVQEQFAIGLFADVHRAADEVGGCMQAQLAHKAQPESMSRRHCPLEPHMLWPSQGQQSHVL